MTMTSAADLAQAVRTEEIEFDDALLDYLLANYLERLDLLFFMTIKIAISFAVMGQWQKDIPFSDDDKLTVQEVIDKFGLRPFVEP